MPATVLPTPPSGAARAATAGLLLALLAPLAAAAQGARATPPRPPVGPAAAAAAGAPAVDTSRFAALRYRMIGPFRGGRSTAVTGIAGSPFTFYMGSTGGGLWKTDDAGTSWRPVSDGFFGGSIGAVDAADSDPNVVYVGTGSADIRGNTSMGHGVWKSVDAGKSWRYAGLPEAGQIATIVVHPRDPDVAYVAALGHAFGKNRERGIFRTTDGGATWQHVLALNDSTGASDVAMSPQNPRVLFAGMWRGERKPWTMISGAPEGGVYRSTDGGDTWTKLGGGLPEGAVGKVGVTVSGADPDRVWAILEAEPAGGVYRSDDGGDTWTRTNAENKLRQRAWYYTHIVADPRDASTVYALNTGMYRSVDGGRTFDDIPVPHGDVHDLWINPADPTVMAVADDGGAQVSLTHGRSWSSMNNQPTAELYDVVVDHAFPYRVYTAQQDNTTISLPAWTSTNSLHPTAEWRYAGGCETGPVALHPEHPAVLWGGCYGGSINRLDTRTEERRNVVAYPQLQLGQAAKDLRYRFQWVAPILVSRHDTSVVYHASQHVHRTRDGGLTWETISPDLTTDTPAHQEPSGGPINNDVTGVEIFNTIFALAEDARDAGTLWAGSDDGRVHVTRDGGASWRDVTPPGMPRFGTVNKIALSPHRSGRAYVTVHRYRLDDMAPYVFRTDDHGATWRRVADGTNGIPANYPVRVVREDLAREGLLYAGTEYGMFVSFDGGGRWQPLQLDLPIVPVVDLALWNDDLVVSTQGRSLYILDDLTPLQQLAAGVPAGPAYLFAPRDAYRVTTGSGSAGGEEVLPEPYPAGALLHYHLAAAPDSARPVVLELLDASGRVVRGWTSDTAQARRWRTPALADSAGMRRVAWDLTYAGPRPVSGVVLWGYAGGVKAPPGTYQVRLTAGGTTQTRELRLRPDPRLPHVTAADYAAQFAAATAVRDTMNAIAHAIETIRAARDQAARVATLAERAPRAAEVRAAADSLARRLTAVEAELTQARSQSGQDPIRFPGRLDNQYAELYGNLTGTSGYIAGGPEGRPSAGALERQRDLDREWAPIAARLRAILERDVPAFNRLVTEAGVTPVLLPPPPAAGGR